MKVTVSRRAHFSAAHRLYNPQWSDAKNLEVFDKCSNPRFHGHNYELMVSVTGMINKDTGYVMDMKDLKQYIKEEVEAPFDHMNLNEDVEDFKNLNPTAENISVVIWNRLRKRLPLDLELKVTLYETPRNIVEYSGN